MGMIEELPPGEDFRNEEYPDEDDGEGTETRPCSKCRAPVYVDAECCPACGEYVTPGETTETAGGRWTWLIIPAIVILGLLAVVLSRGH